MKPGGGSRGRGGEPFLRTNSCHLPALDLCCGHLATAMSIRRTRPSGEPSALVDSAPMVDPEPQSGSWYADRIAASTAPMIDAMISAEPDGQRRHQQRHQPLDRAAHLAIEDLGDLQQHRLEMAGASRRPRAGGSRAAGTEPIGPSGSASPRPSLTAVVVSLSASRSTAFAERSPGDRERVQERHAVRQQGAERAREARRVDLDQQAAEQRHA